MNAEIIRIMTDKGYGFIRGEDGQEYFAHRSAFLGNIVFETVREGQRVTFDASRGPKGLRAENVRFA